MNRKSRLMLGIAWWNTGLSPLGKCRANKQEKEIASQIIRSIIYDRHIDCFAFGEVTTTDLHYIVDSCSLNDYEVFDDTLKKGRLQFDTAVIYNKHRLKISDSRRIVSTYGRQHLKIAQRVDFTTSETQERLHIYVIHWPSRRWSPQDSAKRDTLGFRLRSNINDLQNEYPPHYPAQVIILGDFNDEPFDQSLAGHLLATRDRTLVKQNDLYFYNPFWRHLGESLPHSYALHSSSICGTCFYQSGEETKWRTFDQIILSSSFLRDDRWHIEEKYTQILPYPLLDESLTSKSNIFDHRPVLTYIQRRFDHSSKEVSHD